MASTLDITSAHKAFPALKPDHQVYFDNAGGSQVLGTVSTAIKNYLEETNVQLGASYDIAKQSTETFDKGMAAAASFMGAEVDEVVGVIPVIGPSTTQLFSNLSQILCLPPASELVISQIDHETNISPWLRLAKLQGHTVKWWKPDPGDETMMLTPQNLQPLLSEKTRLVTCTHTSNVLGGIHDIWRIADTVHTIPGAMLCVDGVALAPHRRINMKELDVDFYSFSWYKVYGPHIAVLYASPTAKARLGSLGHYFHAGDALSTKLGLAAASYELVAAIPSIVSYLPPEDEDKWEAIAKHEEELQDILLTHLRSRRDVKIYGHKTAERRKRVPVVSFSVEGRGAREVVEEVEKRSAFGLRWGHFYSKRLVDEVLGLGEVEGVVRVSLVHYNTVEEVR
ncbi:MAG: hypothetical protein Q9164_006281, partial [Protoblastenia rupestris]